MEKNALWELFIKKNPNFLTGPINFKPESLRKFFDTVYDQAVKNTKASSTQNMGDSDAFSFLKDTFGFRE